MTSVAYRYENTARTRRAAPPPVRVVRGGRSGLGKAKAVARRAALILVAVLALALVVSIVATQAQITAVSGQIASVNSDLSEAQSTYDYLSTTIDNITSRANIQEIAEGRLGLVKADPSQITYIRLEDQSVIETTTGAAARLLETFRTAALDLLGNFDP